MEWHGKEDVNLQPVAEGPDLLFMAIQKSTLESIGIEVDMVACVHSCCKEDSHGLNTYNHLTVLHVAIIDMKTCGDIGQVPA